MSLFKKYVTPVLLVVLVASYSSIEAIDFNYWFDGARSGANQACNVLKRKKVWMPIVATAATLCLLKGMISYGEKSLNEDIKSFEEKHNDICGYLGSLNSSSVEEMADEKISEIYQNLCNYYKSIYKNRDKLQGYLGTLPSVGHLHRIGIGIEDAEKYLSQYRPSVCQRLALLFANIDEIRQMQDNHEKIEVEFGKFENGINWRKFLSKEALTQDDRDEFNQCLKGLSEELSVANAGGHNVKGANKK